MLLGLNRLRQFFAFHNVEIYKKKPLVNAEILVDYIISGLTHISTACFTWIWIIESGNCRCVKPTNPGPRCKVVPTPLLLKNRIKLVGAKPCTWRGNACFFLSRLN